ncbi:PSD1 and planctomycete cytochrome C domain-containing protein [Candidatus Laterigemmans baculatus]|uniref:PSD1 and planctomycete cytochrome C domain-containing protein n=1 Tax=Candidatus Laterigemmans baculatus TaxID=2770505 RepID=UPI0013DD2A8C|nr:PSD1 and planctomycete cytochrome C domain-containing protein [Candidatus Laterigemmans baculatus]
MRPRNRHPSALRPTLAASFSGLIHFFGAAASLFFLAAPLATAEDASRQPPPEKGAEVDFAREVLPILSNHCFACHGPDEGTREAGLRLDTPEGAYEDLGGYQAVVPHAPQESAVVERITTSDTDMLMPPADSNLALTPEQIDVLQRWIASGANYDQHWAFQPIRRPTVPREELGERAAWVRQPIDAFVLRRLRQEGLEPAPEADRSTQIRRVYLDLLGLPPSVEAVEAFLGDRSPGAYQRMLDRAFANPHYGERWGRHWLDGARYADTNGYTVDSERSIWPYRDWVIDAINADQPFDQFTIEQLAGDLLPDATEAQRVATGFHRNTLVNQEGGSDREQFRNEAVVDRTNTTGAVWLGLTVGCAQCHTHKFDPLTHHEYYQLFAFFNSSRDANSTTPALRLESPEQKQRLSELDREIAAAKKAGDAAEQKKLEEAKKRFVKQIPTTMVMEELETPRETFVHIRGDFLRHGDRVEPDVPAVLPPLPESDAPATRLDLARWLVDGENPLTARVTANRIWMRLFGTGLVETENDFGLQGTPPTHPELLDWLALELIDGDWSIKRLQRTILSSATYRQSSRVDRRTKLADPLNKLLGRQVRIRVEAETVRDIAVAASGLLDRRLGGKSVHPPQPSGVYAFTQRGASWPTSSGGDRYRRGMYTFFMRSAPYPMLTTFDTPRFNTTCTRRVRSNTPLQSLTMANSEAMLETARGLAARLLRYEANDAARIEFAFQLCFARSPSPEEAARLLRFLRDERASFAADPESAQAFVGQTAAVPDDGTAESKNAAAAEVAAWTALARVLLNLDEFITRE